MPPKKIVNKKPIPKGCEMEPLAIKKDNDCDKVITVPQLTGVCWFTAILMSIFFSENSRKLLLNKMETTKMSLELKAILWDIMQRRYKSAYEMKDYAYMFFKAITPESILKKLHEENAKTFEFDPEVSEGYLNYMYLPKVYEYMGAKDILMLDYESKTKTLYHSVAQAGIDLKPSDAKKTKYFPYVKPSLVKLQNEKEYDVVLIYINDLPMSNKVYETSHSIKDTFVHRGKTYVLDSLLLSNFNYSHCKKGHDISGVTCDGKRYMYNGWMRNTIDRSMIGKAPVRTLPCEIMEFDWLNNKEDFCINPLLCKLDSILGDNKTRIDKYKKEICFNVHKGERVYVYINKDRSQRQPTPKSPKTPDDVDFDKILADLDKKECPPGKVMNPKTGRCVKDKAASKKKECPPGKVMNPKTGRCVKDKAASEKKECPPGKVVNPKTGRCVKDKATSKKKECPPGKVVNPKTGRCVKGKGVP